MTDPTAIYARAVDALNRGNFTDALALASQLVPLAPTHGGVRFVAGVAALQLNQLPLAVQSLGDAVRLNPARPDYGAQWARALAASQLMPEAVKAADAAAALPSEDPLTLDTLGIVFTQVNAHAKAAPLFRRAAALRPRQASYRFNLATSLMFSGDIEGAEAEYEACLACDPRYWKAHLALAQLRRQTASSNHVARLEDLLSTSTGHVEAQLYLNLALSKEHEDLGDYPRAFDHLVTGKAAGRRGRDYSPARDEALFDAIMRAFPEPTSRPPGHDSREPIFIVGMPRTGTTLVERIISSHPLVHSAGELPNFGVILKRASGSRTRPLLDPDTVMRARNIEWAKLGAGYIASTRPGTGHTPYFIDKLPHNFLYAGFIAHALPNARIICLRRDPLDTCLSNFRQLFALGSPYYDYSFDVFDTARYYVLFDRLMAHWHRVLPGRILEIGYEEIVASQEECTRRLLEFCGLPWDERCLNFEHNEAPVATASAAQVRSPIYRSSLQRWKCYESQLEGVRRLLDEQGIRT